MGGSGGAILAPRNHAGGPWEQQDGLGMLAYRILLDLGMILGPVYISFVSSRNLNFHFVFGLVFRSFFIDFRIEIPTFETSKSRVSHGSYCINRLFTQIDFIEFRSRFSCFLEALNTAFLVF